MIIIITSGCLCVTSLSLYIAYVYRRAEQNDEDLKNMHFYIVILSQFIYAYIIICSVCDIAENIFSF
jgi:heme/copper-type cytochrome/quinol oxidase subunit 2